MHVGVKTPLYEFLKSQYILCPIYDLLCHPSGDYHDDHVFSLYFMIPFFFTNLALFYHNW